jgi:hypothetical protein
MYSARRTADSGRSDCVSPTDHIDGANTDELDDGKSA